MDEEEEEEDGGGGGEGGDRSFAANFLFVVLAGARKLASFANPTVFSMGKTLHYMCLWRECASLASFATRRFYKVMTDSGWVFLSACRKILYMTAQRSDKKARAAAAVAEAGGGAGGGGRGGGGRGGGG